MNFHPRNRYSGKYDFDKLFQQVPALQEFILLNNKGVRTLSFAEDKAVRLLNKALVAEYYDVHHWDFPDSYLCPSVPGRAEYIHQIADLLARYHDGKIPRGNAVKGVDIGTGAGMIYPVIGAMDYGWNFVGTEVDKNSLAFAQKVLSKNEVLGDKIGLILQEDRNTIFNGVFPEDSFYDFTMCNPPFYSSKEEAEKQAARQYTRLTGKKSGGIIHKGTESELTYAGGEWGFLRKMAMESTDFSEQIYWFTSLVSKKDNLKPLYSLLRKVRATKVETIPINLKNKNSRIVAWTFMSKSTRKQLQNRTFE